MAAIRVPTRTNNASYPIWNPDPVDLSINADPALRRRIKGRRGHLTSGGTVQHDYAVDQIGAVYAASGVTSAPAASLAGLGALTFDGSGGQVDLGAAVPIGASYTVFVAFGAVVGGNGTLLGSSGFGAIIYLENNKLRVVHSGSQTTPTSVSALSAPQGGNLAVLSYDAASQQITMRVNGQAYYTGGLGPSTVAFRYVGRAPDFANLNLSGAIGEVIVFSGTLASARVTAIEGFLRAMYGIAASV